MSQQEGKLRRSQRAGAMNLKLQRLMSSSELFGFTVRQWGRLLPEPQKSFLASIFTRTKFEPDEESERCGEKLRFSTDLNTKEVYIYIHICGFHSDFPARTSSDSVNKRSKARHHQTPDVRRRRRTPASLHFLIWLLKSSIESDLNDFLPLPGAPADPC